MNDVLIKNGTVINPMTNLNEKKDVLIEGGYVKKIGNNLTADAPTIDASDCYVMPGFIDLHVHLRDPGQTKKEDIESGSKAAARGGYTTIVAMPNTSPVADNLEILQYVESKAKRIGLVNVIPAGSITKGMHGKELTDIEAFAKAGVRALSEDGKSVMNAKIYREALWLAAKNNIPVFAHCEEKDLAGKGVINQGDKAEQLGLLGISNAVENIIAFRDILLAEETNARLHLCHCSTKESIDFIRYAKQKGIAVSGEVCPHHFTLSEDDIIEDDANYKMNPPLRKPEDVKALRKGLIDGSIEVISTDHAPHTKKEKAKGFKDAPFGIVGLETAAALAYTELVKMGYLTISEMVEKMSCNPARILGIDRGNIAESKVADIVIFRPDVKYRIHGDEFAGKGKNMPYENRKVFGKVMTTILAGKVTYECEEMHC